MRFSASTATLVTLGSTVYAQGMNTYVTDLAGLVSSLTIFDGNLQALNVQVHRNYL